MHYLHKLLLICAVFLALQGAPAHASQYSSNSSASIGVSVGTSGFSVNASGSKAKGQGNGNETSYNNTHLNAGQQINIQSGGDTSLIGAVATANRITANIGGKLTIQSLQDQAHYDSKQSSIGGSLSVGANTSGSLNYSQTKINSDYQSVEEQSGFRAGDGGFSINAQGGTSLIGGAITSTQKAIDDNKNTFTTTGPLTLTDLQNQAQYQGESVGVNIGAGLNQKGTVTPMGSSAGYGETSGNASSTTASAISGIAGNKEARTGDAETGIGQIFKQEQVQQEIEAQVQITRTFGQLASKAVGDYAQNKLQEAKDLRTQGREQEAQEIENQWGENGTAKLAAHTVIGGLTGGIGGAAGAAAGTLAAPLVNDALQQAGIEGGLAKAITALASTAAGAAVGGEIGATTAFNEVTNNYLSHAEDSRRKALEKQLKEKQQCQTDTCRKEAAGLEKEIAQLNALDQSRNMALAKACNPQTGTQEACNAQIALAKQARQSYVVRGGELVATTNGREHAEINSLLNAVRGSFYDPLPQPSEMDPRTAGILKGTAKTIYNMSAGLIETTFKVPYTIVGAGMGDEEKQQILGQTIDGLKAVMESPMQKIVLERWAHADALEAAGHTEEAYQIRTEIVGDLFLIASTLKATGTAGVNVTQRVMGNVLNRSRNGVVAGNGVKAGGTIELFTDARGPQVPGAIGVGPKDITAVAADARNMPNIPSNSQARVIVNNPFIPKEVGGTGSVMDFLPEAQRITQQGGRVVLNMNGGNPNFKSMPTEIQLQQMGFKIEYQGPLLPEYQTLTFQRLDGSQIPSGTMKTIVLVKR